MSNRATRPRLGDILVQRGLITQETLSKALAMHKRTGDPLGRILIAQGLIRRQSLYQVLAELWDLHFVDLLQLKPNKPLARRFDPKVLAEHKFVPLMQRGQVVAVATGERPNQKLTNVIRETLGDVNVQYAITTEWDIDYTIRDIFREELLDEAVMGLYKLNPQQSQYTVMTTWQFLALVLFLVVLLVSLYLAPWQTIIMANLLANVGFMIGVLFKFIVSLAGARKEQVEYVTDEEVEALQDDELPIYTILVPAYREASVVPMLMDNLRDLDYPSSKLEILLLLEEDDQETIQAARKAKPPETVTFITIPNGQPKTKPKACNVGLFFSRGEYLVIYDAEDKPEPDQLKKAVVAFRKGESDLACVQAALNYFNRDENFLTRMFTLEYSYWFDYMLPGLDHLKLPIPLGGTSNHFKTSVLRQLGGWDPFNVTEDADLGIRAAANGYKVGVINSTTYEEANSQYGNWIRQRSRWIKGYMQTVLVHSRDPIGLIRWAGWRDALSFISLIGGTPLTFLAAPVLWFFFLVWTFTYTQAYNQIFPPIILYISLFNLLVGNGLMIYLNMLAVFKRRYYGLTFWALLNPLYWVLHSIASYKALWQLFTNPFFWEKTHHGISTQLAHLVTEEA
ncbi:MAG: glycosyltransferase [Ardenticatenaceae bacterium]